MRRGLDICAELGADIAHVAGHRLRDGVSAVDGRKMIAEGLLGSPAKKWKDSVAADSDDTPWSTTPAGSDGETS